MIQLTPQLRIPVAVEAADFRRGIDCLAAVARLFATFIQCQD